MFHGLLSLRAFASVGLVAGLASHASADEKAAKAASTPTAAAPAADDKAQLAKGQEIYKTNCFTCHGEKYDGMGPAGQYLNPKPRNLVSEKFKNGETIDEIVKTVTDGLKGTPMPPFPQLSESDRKAISVFVVSLRKK